MFSAPQLRKMSSEAIPGPSRAPFPRVHEVASMAVRAAANGSSNGSSDTPGRPRKRPRRPETWKKNAAKLKRAKGERYTSPSTGKVIEERRTGAACRCKRRKCFDQFSEEEMEGIIEDFNDIANKELQDAHLFGLIRPVEVKRRRPRRGSASKTRRANYSYNVSLLFFTCLFSPLCVLFRSCILLITTHSLKFCSLKCYLINCQ